MRNLKLLSAVIIASTVLISGCCRTGKSMNNKYIEGFNERPDNLTLKKTINNRSVVRKSTTTNRLDLDSIVPINGEINLTLEQANALTPEQWDILLVRVNTATRAELEKNHYDVDGKWYNPYSGFHEGGVDPNRPKGKIADLHANVTLEEHRRNKPRDGKSLNMSDFAKTRLVPRLRKGLKGC